MKIKFNNDIARKEIRSYILANYNKIEVKPGKCRWNFYCHANSVHTAQRKKHKKLAMVVYIDDDNYPIVHFINYRKGKYKDNTLGEWSTQYEYYFIKWLDQKDMYDIFTIFDAFKKELGKQLNWWTRYTSDWRG